jgi:hypothetical protein
VSVDLATADQMSYPDPGAVTALALGEAPHEIIFATEGETLVRFCGEDRRGTRWPNGPVRQFAVAGQRVLVRTETGVWNLRLQDLSVIQKLPIEDETGPILELAVDPHDWTLYTVHPGKIRVCPWRGDGWQPDGPAAGVSGYDGDSELAVSEDGVFMTRAGELVHFTRQGSAFSSVALEKRATELSADPSTARFALRSGSTVIVGEHDAAGLVRKFRFDADPIEAVAVGAADSLVATAGGGVYQLWYTGDEFVEEDASQLELGPEEAEFVASLGPVVPTARSAKRLVNVYRVLRASRVGRRLSDPASGEYKVALLLLSLVTGWPHLAPAVLRELKDGTAGSWPELLDAVRGKLAARDEAALVRGPGREDEDGEILDRFQRLFEGAQADLGRCRAWVPDVRRFSVPAGDHMRPLV